MRNNVYSDIFWYKDILLPVSGEKKKWKFSKFHVLNIYDKLWGNDITNSLIWIFIRTGQKMFSENMWNFKMSQLPYFLSDFHHFCTNLKGIFTLSFEIMVILDWISPLNNN